MITQHRYSPESLIQPADCGIWLLVDELLETRRQKMARRLLQKFRKCSVKIHPPSKKKTQDFIAKVIKEAKGLHTGEPLSPLYQNSAEALLASIENLNQNVGAKDPGWLESYNKFHSSFCRFTKLHLLRKAGLGV